MADPIDFSAVPSLLGYLYQLRLALWEALKKLKDEKPFTIAIESLDDIEIEFANQTELIQAKHRSDKGPNLTDASSDLWKTIRIWCEGIENGTILIDNLFFLVTTAVAPAGTAAFFLKETNERNIKNAIDRLSSTARSSSSDKNQAGYNAFKKLSATQLEALFSNVYILDSAPSISELDEKIRKELFYLAEPKFLSNILERLEGWWNRRIIQQLLLKRLPVLSEEIVSETGRLREQFKSDNLPIDDAIFQTEIDATGYQDSIFVKQLEWIGIGRKRILIAIRDYYRAFTQRSKWVREELLYVGELSRYERRLVEEWERHFERVCESMIPEATEIERQALGRELYQIIENDVNIRIRSNVSEPTISRGSYQILSDKMKVGWHPGFQERLKKLLQPAGG